MAEIINDKFEQIILSGLRTVTLRTDSVTGVQIQWPNEVALLPIWMLGPNKFKSLDCRDGIISIDDQHAQVLGYYQDALIVRRMAE